MKVIVLYKNTVNTSTSFLYAKRRFDTNTPYYGIRLTNDMTGESFYYNSVLVDVSIYPDSYTTFTGLSPANLIEGDYTYEVGQLVTQNDTSFFGEAIEIGKLKVIQTETETVFSSEEDKSNAVFDED